MYKLKVLTNVYNRNVCFVRLLFIIINHYNFTQNNVVDSTFQNHSLKRSQDDLKQRLFCLLKT